MESIPGFDRAQARYDSMEPEPEPELPCAICEGQGVVQLLHTGEFTSYAGNAIRILGQYTGRELVVNIPCPGCRVDDIPNEGMVVSER